MANEPEQPPTQIGQQPTQAEQSPTSPPTEHWAPPTQPWTPASPPAGRRRVPRWLIAIGAVTAVLSVTSFFTVLFWPSDPAAPLSYQAFERTGTVEVGEEDRVLWTRIGPDRAYFATETPGGLTVIAADRSGVVAWDESVDDMTEARTFSVTPDAVLVYGGSGTGTSAETRVVALDPASGVELWRRDFPEDGGWRVFADMLVFSEPGQQLGSPEQPGRVFGVEPGSGDVAWELLVPAEAEFAVEPVLTAEDLARPSRPVDTHDVPRQGDRVAVAAADGSARVVNIHSGDVVSEGAGVASSSDRVFAYGDELYVADTGDGRLYRFDLTQLGAPPDVWYTAPGAEWSPEQVVTCGDQRVCVLVDGDTAEDDPQVLALTSGGVAWNSPVPDIAWLLPAGDHLVAVTGEPAIVVFDRAGEQVFERPGAPVRLNPGNLLLFAAPPTSSSLTNLSAAGVSLGAGDGDRRHELGQLPEVRAEGCTWDEDYLACPSEDGAGIWRFTS